MELPLRSWQKRMRRGWECYQVWQVRSEKNCHLQHLHYCSAKEGILSSVEMSLGLIEAMPDDSEI
jgi:hypothetical protein